jgi:hypothetical protein
MPCRDYDDGDALRDMSARNNKLVRMLCYVLKHTTEEVIMNNSELAAWKARHDEQDLRAARQAEIDRKARIKSLEARQKADAVELRRLKK